MHINPQTTLLCEMLGLTDPFAVFSGKQSHTLAAENLQQRGRDDSDVGFEDDEEGKMGKKGGMELVGVVVGRC